jgi:DNA-binding transcriptional ArsR family regulator
MAPLPFDIQKVTQQSISVSLEPVHNIGMSMMLLLKEEEMPGLPDWISKVRARMTTQEFQDHRFVIIGFYFATLPEDTSWTSYPAYLDHLAGMDPNQLRDKMLNAYAEIGCKSLPVESAVDWDHILSSPENYVDFLKSGFGEDHVETDIEVRAYEYVLDPPAMQTLIVDHLRRFWDQHMSTEWARVQPLLAESARAFQSLDFTGKSRLEVARLITGQDLTESGWKDMHWEQLLDMPERLVFTPNPHIGPYLNKLMCGDTLIVFFGARLPEESEIRIPELDRADIVSRLSALADDTRLQILQMIAERTEMRAQEIIDATHLSQPSVSRYLNQLTATGYLQERRRNGVKVYGLNRDRIEKTIQAVSAFLLGR